MIISGEILSELDKQISNYCAYNNIFGALRITLRDKIFFQKSFGYADIEKKIQFTKRSMFTFYSLSKPFCVMGLMKLKDKGLVDIDTHPKTYVPEANGFDERVTVRHLLHHVSGLPDFYLNQEFKNKYSTGYASQIREQMKEIVKYPQAFEPGTKTQCANINMILCALIIENVSGMPYDEYMKREIFEPLDMRSAVVDNENLHIDGRVLGYDLVEGEITQINKCYDWLFGAGDIVGTVDDVYALNLAIKNKLLLNEDTWRDILTPYPINSFGCGCTVSYWHGKYCITHNGGHLGFRTLHIQIPEDDFDIIFLSNSGYGNARNDISEMIHTAFYDDSVLEISSIEMDKGYI